MFHLFDKIQKLFYLLGFGEISLKYSTDGPPSSIPEVAIIIDGDSSLKTSSLLPRPFIDCKVRRLKWIYTF